MKTQIKTCGICKLPINEKKEYCEFIQYKKLNDILSRAYYHVNCFKDRLHGSKEQKEALEKSMRVLDNVQKKFGLEEDKKEEVVYIN